MLHWKPVWCSSGEICSIHQDVPGTLTVVCKQPQVGYPVRGDHLLLTCFPMQCEEQEWRGAGPKVNETLEQLRGSQLVWNRAYCIDKALVGAEWFLNLSSEPEASDSTQILSPGKLIKNQCSGLTSDSQDQNFWVWISGASIFQSSSHNCSGLGTTIWYWGCQMGVFQFKVVIQQWPSAG